MAVKMCLKCLRKMNSIKTDKFTLFVYCKFLVLLKVQPYAVKT